MFLTIMGIVRIINTFIRGKRAGIIKVCIKPVAVIISSVPVCVMAILIGIEFSTASEARKDISEWEQLKGTEYSEYYTEYYNDFLYRHSGTEITDFDKFVGEQIGILQSRADHYTYGGVMLLLLMLLMLTSVFDKIFYLTESGIFTRLLKQPEEFFIKRREDMLDVYFKAPSDRTKPLISFKSTPGNLAKLGRFIEWEEVSEAYIGTEDS